MIIARPDIFLINVGYSNRVITIEELLTTLMIELAVEFCVDAMALHKEINKASIPVHKYRTWSVLLVGWRLLFSVLCPARSHAFGLTTLAPSGSRRTSSFHRSLPYLPLESTLSSPLSRRESESCVWRGCAFRAQD